MKTGYIIRREKKVEGEEASMDGMSKNLSDTSCSLQRLATLSQTSMGENLLGPAAGYELTGL